MEFWGVEVKAGEPLKVQPEFGKLIHISQAALGEVKDVKGAKYVPLHLKVDSKNFIIGSLSAEDRTQLMFDLVFEKEFELSHDWKNGSIYFMGYVADDPVSDGEEFSDESEEEPMEIQENGKIKPKCGVIRAGRSLVIAAKAGSKKEEQPDSDEDDDDEDDESNSDDELPSGGLGEDSDDDSDENDEEEELPKKSNKRPAESPQKTPVPSKKAKSATPDKSGNKKGGQNGKTPAGNAPKSAGQLTCKSCSKAFNSDKALESHSKAKHGGK